VSGWPDRLIAGLAESQHGLLTRHQLLALGLGRGAIEHAVVKGRILIAHRGVYAIGHRALPPLAPCMGAVLACGEGAFLSHHAAAWVWGIRPSVEGDIDVTVPGRFAGRRRGVRVHRSVGIESRDVRRYQNIPIASPARTLLEVAPDLTERDLERAFDEALVRRLVTVSAVRGVLDRYPRRRGAGRLRSIARADRRTTLTRSVAEELFIALIRRAELPQPDVNARIGGHEVDFLWRPERLVVEIDGYAFHRVRGKFERDRQRDGELLDAGWTVMRLTWRQLERTPEAVLVRLARALARRESATAGQPV
jgi:very-short-patch-repair endonuclease